MKVQGIFIGCVSVALLMVSAPCHAGGPLGRMARQSLRTRNALSNIIRYHSAKDKSYHPVVSRFIQQVEHKPWERSSPAALMYTSLGAQAVKFNPYYRPKLSIQETETVLQGKREKMTLDSEELESFYLAGLPLAVVEGPYILTPQEHQKALEFYRGVLEYETGYRQDSWAKRMSAITNLGFLGSHEDAEIILSAALQNNLPLFEPWTDLIVLRALLNLEGYNEIKELLAFRLAPKKGEVFLPKLSPAWKMLLEWEMYRMEKGMGDYWLTISSEDILPLKYALPEKVQYLLASYNSYNMINLDFSAGITEAFLDLRRGMLDKIREDKDAYHAKVRNLELQVRNRLNTTYNHALQETENPANIRPDDLFPGSGRMFLNPEECVSGFFQRLYPQTAETVNLLPEQMLVRHNLQVSRWFPELTRRNELIEQNAELIDALKEGQVYPSGWEMMGLAEQVGLSTRNLLVGNGHITHSWKRLVDLSTALRVLQPRREIIVFTNLFTKMDPIARSGMKYDFEERQITIKDLAFDTKGNSPILVTDNTQGYTGVVQEVSFWNSLEGIRLQTDYFAKQIAQARKEHPAALFVIYMPSIFVDKLAPFSLGSRLSKEDTFVALLQTATPKTAQEMSLYDNFRSFQSFAKGQVYQTEFVLKMSGNLPMIDKIGPNGGDWKQVPLSDVVGFDIRILLP